MRVPAVRAVAVVAAAALAGGERAAQVSRERWRKVRRAEGYKVSSEGRMRGPMGPLTLFPDRDGYLRVSIHDEQVLVHLVVLEAFHGPRPYGKPEGLHGPGGCQDNRAEVLRWGTRQENEEDRKRDRKARSADGTSPYVSAAPRTKVPC